MFLRDHHHARQARSADRKRRLSAQAPQPEMSTLKESLSLHSRRRLHLPYHQTGRTVCKINAGKHLIDERGADRDREMAGGIQHEAAALVTRCR
jgi:hypothetical protein